MAFLWHALSYWNLVCHLGLDLPPSGFEVANGGVSIPSPLGPLLLILLLLGHPSVDEHLARLLQWSLRNLVLHLRTTSLECHSWKYSPRRDHKFGIHLFGLSCRFFDQNRSKLLLHAEIIPRFGLFGLLAGMDHGFC